MPLRELTEAEVFERDEAVIGDLRRRRASGENYVVDGLGEAIVIEVKQASPFENQFLLTLDQVCSRTRTRSRRTISIG